ncbi:GatB/YqeY domain-containing protein [Paracoccaceae bacterium GXU_MW_L88]
MPMRSQINTQMKEAMKAKDSHRLGTLRLINAAIKDRDIAARTHACDRDGVSDAEIRDVLAKMIKQRRDSIKVYEEAGRLDAADQEAREIDIIAEFLPKQLSEDESGAAIDAAISETGASSIRDMGKVMGALKEKYAGQMDFAKAGATVKQRLG